MLSSDFFFFCVLELKIQQKNGAAKKKIDIKARVCYVTIGFFSRIPNQFSSKLIVRVDRRGIYFIYLVTELLDFVDDTKIIFNFVRHTFFINISHIL